jgi:hypothetical protein
MASQLSNHFNTLLNLTTNFISNTTIHLYLLSWRSMNFLVMAQENFCMRSQALFLHLTAKKLPHFINQIKPGVVFLVKLHHSTKNAKPIPSLFTCLCLKMFKRPFCQTINLRKDGMLCL